MSARAGTHSIVVGDAAALGGLGPAAVCGVEITRVAFHYAINNDAGAVTRVVISGLCGGTPGVEVALLSEGFDDVTLVPVDADGRFSRTVDLPTPIPLGDSLNLSAQCVGAAGCSAFIERTVVLSLAGSPYAVGAAFPEGPRAGANPQGYVAGHADRFVYRGFFNSLLISSAYLPRWERNRLRKTLMGAGASARNADTWIDEFQTAAARTVPQVLAEGPGDHDERVRNALLAAERVATRAAPLLPPNRAAAKARRRAAIWQGLRSSVKASAPRNVQYERTTIGRGLSIEIALAQGRTWVRDMMDLLATRTRSTTMAFGKGVVAAVRSGVALLFSYSWLAVLYYDRLRIRPAGMSVGEPVFSLPLGPGDEVTLTQRSETKRSESLEEINDRTAESEQEFSSTWSTEMTNAITETDTRSSGKSLGGSVSGEYKGITGSVVGSVSVADSHARSTTEQTTQSKQQTQKVATRLKVQHKTTFKISTDTTSEFGSRRVVRNANPLRALMFHFYKLYQKLRVVLERYDAKLALCVLIRDPGRDLRLALEAELERLTPALKPGQVTIAGAETRNEDRTISSNGGDEGTASFIVTLEADRSVIDCSFEVLRFIIEIGDDTDEMDASGFEDWGGSFTVDTVPSLPSSGNVTAEVSVKMPSLPFIGMRPIAVEGRFTWHIGASEAALAAFNDRLAKIREEFNADGAQRLIDAVTSRQKNMLQKRLLDETLLVDFASGEIDPPPELTLALNRWFDWDELHATYMPWWLTRSGREAREYLKTKMQELPSGILPAWTIPDEMVASFARIMVPIRRGAELDVLRFALGYEPPADLVNVVGDIEAYRANLDPAPRAQPAAAAILAPAPERGTPLGDAAWAHQWEDAPPSFEVLDEWAELIPTDGVHIESVLADSSSADESRAAALQAELGLLAGQRAVLDARADAIRSGRADIQLNP